MKYYLINEIEFSNYILGMQVMVELMNEGKIPYDENVKQAFKNSIKESMKQEPFKEADD